MRPESQHLLTALEFGRTYLAELWQRLSLVMTLEPGKQRETLRLILDELHDGSLIEYPKSQQLWDRSALPHLPEWVTKSRSKNERAFAGGLIWSPELSFLADKSVYPDSPWLAVDAWLKKTRRGEITIKPLRERSLDIFDDEKTLDLLVTKLPFKSRCITLETLGCFYVPEPIPWVPGPVGSESRHGLCIENSTTYDTLCRFNRDVGLWAFVAYGRGNGFASMADGIAVVVESYSHNRLMYFGDADLEGIEIAARGAKRLLELGITVELDHRLYNLLIKFGHVAPSKTGGEVSKDATRLLAEAELSSLSDMFMRYQRIAQEWAGLEALKSTFNSALTT
ncbi:MAG: Wadjet anti-phage system protein JetD domain-containing protein [Pedobacter sp.]